MPSRSLQELLSRYDARFPAEHATTERIRALITTHEKCFDRTCRPGHVTGSAWVLSADRQRCLLVHHRKLDRWVQPGGHADGDADVLAVAMREAREETGLPDLQPIDVDTGKLQDDPCPLDIDIHVIPARFDQDGNMTEDAHEHHDVRFLLAATHDSPVVVSEESHDVRWYRPAAIEELTSEESVLRLLRKSRSVMA